MHWGAVMKVLITGSSGTIGTVLVGGLADRHAITPFDLPNDDVRDYEQLFRAMSDVDCVVHLAWDTNLDNWQSGRISTDNTIQIINVLNAAVAAETKRVILASSVHADRYADRGPEETRKPLDVPEPDSPYGAHKCFMEALGRYYAMYAGLVVICIRFGGVYRDDLPPSHSTDAEWSVWLSKRDCIDLVDACIKAERSDHDFEVLYGISKTIGRIQDMSNRIGWEPRVTAPRRVDSA